MDSFAHRKTETSSSGGLISARNRLFSKGADFNPVLFWTAVVYDRAPFVVSGMSFNDNDSEWQVQNIPLLSKEGQARSVSPVGRNIKKCSKSRNYLIDAREAHLINRYCSSLNSC